MLLLVAVAVAPVAVAVEVADMLEVVVERLEGCCWRWLPPPLPLLMPMAGTPPIVEEELGNRSAGKGKGKKEDYN